MFLKGLKNTEKTLCAVKTHAIFSAQNFWAMFHVEHSKKNLGNNVPRGTM